MLRALTGGALIGLAATLYWFVNGRVAGISGILSGAMRERDDRADRLLFLVGLVAAGGFAALVTGPAPGSAQATLPLVLAGALVGFGTRLGGGCTSGHGVCGLSRLSRRSLVATMTFVAVGAATVFVVARVAPGWSVR
ncbi:MAG TPA: YeeE/YedE thiosulfate transporter family protein [Polyangia bacterium]|nr:YeeE/YedE thiosulfate transporter family protein [Polyangia bacterium]